ncbi:hypothetical protein RUM43_005249 [Polyplax serrata]|uniref:Transmembrane protein n=1 Tax=Polyplax serrata TaxID=468196 RepID=A0AAN8NZS9_POLSC
MHFWIDKRSQTYGFNDRRGIPASLASGRRRKSLVAPVHRLQAVESATVSHQIRRNYQQSVSQPRSINPQGSQCQTTTILSNSTESTSVSISPRPSSSQELDPGISYLEAPHEVSSDIVPHAQLMRLGGLTKYGMWASFGLTTISVAATKFYVDHQGTFEILLLCTLVVLSAGLLVSCILTLCKQSTSASQFVSVESTAGQPRQPRTMGTDISEGDIFIDPLTTSISRQSTMEARNSHEVELPPPPYDIAILLPVKGCADYPPPSYENAVR